MSVAERGERRVELCLRSLADTASGGPAGSVLDRVRQLDRQGAITSVDVRVWGRAFDPTGAVAETAAGQFVATRVQQFSDWAAANDATLSGGFEREEVQSMTTDAEYTRVRFPVCTLAEFVGDDPVFVAPCSTPEGHHTVDDRLDALAARQRVPTLSQD